jgi:L-alanine-DL-glutamate epimerase-like enolase superfamily enzyme
MVGGGKFRDKIRIYADTTESKDPKIYAQRLKERKEVMGLTWLKMDLGVEMVSDTPGTVTGPSELTQWEENQWHSIVTDDHLVDGWHPRCSLPIHLQHHFQK